MIIVFCFLVATEEAVMTDMEEAMAAVMVEAAAMAEVVMAAAMEETAAVAEAVDAETGAGLLSAGKGQR